MNWKRLQNRIRTVLAVVLLTGCLCACGSSAATEPETVEETAAPTPSATPTPTATPEPLETPYVYDGPDLAEQPRADDSFFADAAFFGNSLVDGLRAFGGLESASFFASTSASVVSVSMTKNMTLSDGSSGTMLQALCEQEYAKLYILLGINEIGFEPAQFIQLYSAVLDTIQESQPDADIYIMSLTPVTERKSAEGALFSEERVLEYNAALYALAAERQCYYVDLVEALAGEDGYLPEEQSTDGIHLTVDKYPEWADYLRTHYVVKE